MTQAQALVILLIVASIFCTIGVELYRGDAPQEFGDFTRAFYTLFGVVAYGKWPEDRIPGFGEDGKLNVVNIVYIYSFVVVVVLVLIQVLVAVLLGRMLLRVGASGLGPRVLGLGSGSRLLGAVRKGQRFGELGLEAHFGSHASWALSAPALTEYTKADNFFRASREQQEHAAAEMMERERQLDNILSQKERYHLDFFMEYLGASSLVCVCACVCVRV